MSLEHMIEFLCFLWTALSLLVCFLTDESPCNSKHYWWYLALLMFIALTNGAYVVLGGA